SLPVLHVAYPFSSIMFPYTTLFRSTVRRTMPALRLKLRSVSVFGAGNGYAHGGRVAFAGAVKDRQLRRHRAFGARAAHGFEQGLDRKSTRLNSSHVSNSYAVFCLEE